MKGANSDPPRDFVGYGRNPPDPKWPGGARIAVNFNLNYEAGGEMTVLEGDPHSEGLLSDTGFPAYEGQRSPLVETAFEYGSRCGVWRVLRIFRDFDIKVSVFGVVRALQQNPDLVPALLDDGHEIVSHGYRWIDYLTAPESIEREHVKLAVEGLEALTGERPKGWMTGRPSNNTRRLIIEHGILYDRDSLGDELPYWVEVGDKAHLVIPYSYETNDNRCGDHNGFSTSEQFFEYMRDCFDLLYREGESQAKLMSVGLHDRLIGRPGRSVGLIRLLEHMRKHEGVWFCRGIDIARHWIATHPFGT